MNLQAQNSIDLSFPEAVQEPNLSTWLGHAEVYAPYLDVMPENNMRCVMEYDQKKDPSCVVFSAAGMISYNTWLEFQYGEIREMWQEFQGNKGGQIYKTSTQIAHRLYLDRFPVNVLKLAHFEKVMDKGYALQISLRCSPYTILEGITDGTITHIAAIKDGKVLKHASIVYRSHTRTYLQNSWLNAGKYNIYDITDVYEEMIKSGQIRQCAMCVLPYNYKGTPGTAQTMKWYSKALAKIGMKGVADIFPAFKKYVAKIDWLVDSQYLIK